MIPFLIRPAARLSGTLVLPGDKSIAHRAAIISAVASGTTRVKNFPYNKDCRATLACLERLGVKVILRPHAREVVIRGRGLAGLTKSGRDLPAGESGTTLRLLTGLLAGQKFSSRLGADASLSRRPMSRLTIPLRRMGGSISGRRGEGGVRAEEYPPLTIQPSSLKGIRYRLPVASAQVKSAILLAGLYAKGKTCVIDPFFTRDHTERMLELFKARIKTVKNKTVIESGRQLTSPGKIFVPGDLSSAAFFIVAAALLPNARLRIRGVSLNPTRAGLLKVLGRMGCRFKVIKPAARPRGAEPYGDIIVQTSHLKPVRVKKNEVPLLIDELPILMVAACFARGRSVIEGAGELRYKETDRIKSMGFNLAKMGVRIRVEAKAGREDLVIEGAGGLSGARVKSFGDHRTAMSMIIAGLAASGNTRIDDISCIRKSFPDFLERVRSLIK